MVSDVRLTNFCDVGKRLQGPLRLLVSRSPVLTFFPPLLSLPQNKVRYPTRRSFSPAANLDLSQRVLMDHIHKAKAEQSRTKVLADQMEARRSKNKAARERRAGRIAEKRSAISAVANESETKE
mgnify:FL=1